MPDLSDLGVDWCGQQTALVWVRWAVSVRDGQVHAFSLDDSQHGRWLQAVCAHLTPPTARHASSRGPRCPACVLGVSAPGTARRHRRSRPPGVGARLWARVRRQRRSPSTPAPEFPDRMLPLSPRPDRAVRVPGAAGPAVSPTPEGLVPPRPSGAHRAAPSAHGAQIGCATIQPSDVRQIGHHVADLPLFLPVTVIDSATPNDHSSSAPPVVEHRPLQPSPPHTHPLARSATVADVSHPGWLAIKLSSAGERPCAPRAYLNNLLERDIRQLSDVHRIGDLRRLAGAVAARSAGLLVAQAVARDVGLAPRTAARYLDLFDLTFLTRRVPAWATNATTRAVATPKLVMTDSGLCAYVLGMSAQRLATPDPAAGPVIETWVMGELGRQLDWNTPEARLYHYRTRDGIEVDAVLEDSQGQVVAVEVKAGETVRGSDFRGLVHLRDRLGARFVAGFVLHLGTASRAFGDRLRALPAAALWTGSP